MKRVAFKTVGCRLNQAETAQMAASFAAHGYAVVPFGAVCDVCVIHTCAITQRAEQKCLTYARAVRRAGSAATVVLAGCAAELDGEALRKRCDADLAVGQRDKFRIPDLLAERSLRSAPQAAIQTTDHRSPIADHLPPNATAGRSQTVAGHVGAGCRAHPPASLCLPASLREALQAGEAMRAGRARLQTHASASHISTEQSSTYHLTPNTSLPLFSTTRALVKVQDGCDFCCAYCIVPAARGQPVSRPMPEILAEIERLADAGFREVVLTGANLGCYSAGGHGLIALVRAVEKIADVDRVRLSSIELSTAEHAIVEHMAGSAKLCPYLHVPLQTGDGRLLSAMGRRYTAAQYRQFVARASKLIPLLGLGTDIMVGLPGEDDSAFAHTLQLVQDLPFSNLHVFPYSKRPGTRAAAMPGPVPAAVKRERSARLIALGEAKRREFAERFVGRPVSVLVERVSAGNIGIGWTRERIEARIATPRVKANDIVEFVPSAVDDDARLV